MSELDSLSAAEVISALSMEYLEGEGVWISLLWRSQHGSAIHCLLTPDDFSALHMLEEDELWVHSAGAPVDMVVLHPDGQHAIHVLGTDLDLGHRPAVRVPAKSWQGSRTRGGWSLVTCALAPPYSGLTLADDETDLSLWGGVAGIARDFVRQEA